MHKLPDIAHPIADPLSPTPTPAASATRYRHRQWHPTLRAPSPDGGDKVWRLLKTVTVTFRFLSFRPTLHPDTASQRTRRRAEVGDCLASEEQRSASCPFSAGGQELRQRLSPPRDSYEQTQRGRSATLGLSLEAFAFKTVRRKRKLDAAQARLVLHTGHTIGEVRRGVSRHGETDTSRSRRDTVST